MNYQSNKSLIVDPDNPPSQGTFPIWSKVFTKPSEKTFVEITEHPEAKARAAYIWVFIAGTLSGLINSLTQAAPEFGQFPGASGMLGTAGLLGAICGAPIAVQFSVIGFAIGVSIVHATAKFLGGQGSFDRLAYAFGAIAVLLWVVSAFMIPLNAIPLVVFCTLPVLFVLGLYVLFLAVTAVKAVHRFSWGEATAALLLPAILFALLCGLLFLVLMRLVGPSINQIFQQLQQGLK
jgi:hypothetical protein